jgi:hypothetical protein
MFLIFCIRNFYEILLDNPDTQPHYSMTISGLLKALEGLIHDLICSEEGDNNTSRNYEQLEYTSGLTQKSGIRYKIQAAKPNIT